MSQEFQVPERLYSGDQLARLVEIASAVKCECPNHLSQIVSKLVGFEDYSKECIVENHDDAEMHALLWRETARARAIMEEALTKLVAFEGFEL